MIRGGCDPPPVLLCTRADVYSGWVPVAEVSSHIAGLAGRYAIALFDLADERKVLDAVADDLRGIRTLLAESDDMQRLITSPAIASDDRVQGIEAVAARAGINQITRNLLGLLAHNRRLFVLPQVIEEFLAELARRRGEVSAEVTSARPLSEPQLAAVTDELNKTMGKGVQVVPKVDPSLIGGLTVRVGSRMIDNSLKTKLARLELVMKGTG